LQDHYHSPTKGTPDHLLTMEDIYAQYSQYNALSLTEGDLRLVLSYLHSTKGVDIAHDIKGYGKSYTVIKFPENSSGSVKAEITQHDKAIISIKTTCRALHTQVDELQRKVEELTYKAKEFYSKKYKARALYCLRIKRDTEQVLEKRLYSLETMETMLMKIEASQNDVQIVRAFNIGADTLRGIISSNGLTLESVEETMFKMQDVLDDQREVEQAIATGSEETNSMQLPAMDEEELERELAAL
ncbi:Snf7-domain-containing protein, partial [Spinellus fusiger]